MAKKLKLHIPQPCHENWQQMTPVEQGRYCMSCSKVVTDFSGMSDWQVLQYLNKTKGSVCGRFDTSQLMRDIVAPKAGNRSWMKYFFQFTLPAFLLSIKLEAQDKKIQKTDSIAVPAIERNSSPIIQKDTVQPAWNIRGVVVDESGELLPGATILVKGTKAGVASDENGRFAVACPGNLEEAVLQVSYIGFEDREIPVRKSENMDEQTVRLTMREATLGEYIIAGMIVTVPEERKPTAWEKVKSILTPGFVKLYPNPLAAGNKLNLEVKVKQTGTYMIHVYQPEGQVVMTRYVDAVSGILHTDIDTGGLLPGNYYVGVTDPGNKKVCTRQVLIQ